jgi:FkbM family methyltransferase
MKNLIIDVGANHGSFALSVARGNKDHLVIAIEPIQALAKSLEKKKFELDNLVVIQGGVSSFFEHREIHISETSDMGTSSFLRFSAESQEDDYWITRKDMKHTDNQLVECRPLSSWLEPWKESIKSVTNGGGAGIN